MSPWRSGTVGAMTLANFSESAFRLSTVPIWPRSHWRSSPGRPLPIIQSKQIGLLECNQGSCQVERERHQRRSIYSRANGIGRRMLVSALRACISPIERQLVSALIQVRLIQQRMQVARMPLWYRCLFFSQAFLIYTILLIVFIPFIDHYFSLLTLRCIYLG
jgi:hypothetical protein